MMEPGTTFVGMKEIWEITIDGRGGDSVDEEYFLNKSDAIMASAVDGPNRTPDRVEVMEFSDGTLMLPGRGIRLSKPLSEEAKQKLLDGMTPAQKILTGHSR